MTAPELPGEPNILNLDMDGVVAKLVLKTHYDTLRALLAEREKEIAGLREERDNALKMSRLNGDASIANAVRAERAEKLLRECRVLLGRQTYTDENADVCREIDAALDAQRGEGEKS